MASPPEHDITYIWNGKPYFTPPNFRTLFSSAASATTGYPPWRDRVYTDLDENELLYWNGYVASIIPTVFAAAKQKAIAEGLTTVVVDFVLPCRNAAIEAGFLIPEVEAYDEPPVASKRRCDPNNSGPTAGPSTSRVSLGALAAPPDASARPFIPYPYTLYLPGCIPPPPPPPFFYCLPIRYVPPPHEEMQYNQPESNVKDSGNRAEGNGNYASGEIEQPKSHLKKRTVCPAWLDPALFNA